MEIELDKDSLSRIAKEIDWGAVPPELSKLTLSPSFYLMQLVHKWEKNIREKLVGFDLTNTQFNLLASLIILTNDGKVITQMDLANFLKADKMMVSEVLRTLERKGFIIRENHPNDRRAKSLIVTDKGIGIFEVALKHAVEYDDQFFSILGDDKDEFIRMLKKFL